MRISVTGHTGYIGSVVVEELLGQNHSVVVVDNLERVTGQKFSHERRS